MFGLISIFQHGNGNPLPESAIIGEDGDNGIIWAVADMEYCQQLLSNGVLEYRGYMVVNDIVVHRYYLPAPNHSYEAE